MLVAGYAGKKGASQYADPSPLVRQGGDIVCAAGNGGNTRDVGSSHPGAGAGPKGRAVRPLKRHASWVQNVVRQFGPYPPWALEVCEESSLVREDRDERASGVSVVVPTALLISHAWMG